MILKQTPIKTRAEKMSEMPLLLMLFGTSNSRLILTIIFFELTYTSRVCVILILIYQNFSLTPTMLNQSSRYPTEVSKHFCIKLYLFLIKIYKLLDGLFIWIVIWILMFFSVCNVETISAFWILFGHCCWNTLH